MTRPGAEFLRPKEIASRLGFSVSWVHDHRAELGLARMGGSWAIHREDLERWINKKRAIAQKENAKAQEATDGTEA